MRVASHEDIPVVVLDTVTGERRRVTDRSWWYWAESNGSCDCNREMLFNDGDLDCDIPCRQARYLIVEVEGDDLAEFNHGYPADLVRKHCVIPPEHWGEGVRSDGSHYFTHADLAPR